MRRGVALIGATIREPCASRVGLQVQVFGNILMRIKTFIVATLVCATLAGPAAAQRARGADDGYRAAGPIGAIVGGAILGGLGGLFGDDRRKRFRDYAASQNHESYAFDGQVEIGAVLPVQGVAYYEIPADYDARGYQYTIVNSRTVIVDPQSRRIVLIVD